jgi:hypothetical protein
MVAKRESDSRVFTAMYSPRMNVPFMSRGTFSSGGRHNADPIVAAGEKANASRSV